MRDSYGRSIEYMRISVTDRCNLRCMYCMPDGMEVCRSHDDILRLEEFAQAAEAAAALGIRYIRLTGGEPLVRKGLPDLVGMLKEIPGIERVSLTTNGLLLPRYLDALRRAGIDGINISLDTLDEERFRRITGLSGDAGQGDEEAVRRILRAAFEASGSGIEVKINAVTLPDTDAEGLISIARDRPIDVRFIEMMPIGYGRRFAGREMSDNRRILGAIREKHPDLISEDRHSLENITQAGAGRGESGGGPAAGAESRTGSGEPAGRAPEGGTGRSGGGGSPESGEDAGLHGPAVYCRIPGYRGRIGFISAIHGKFCGSCNRVRLTSTGFLKTCLCYEDGADLRSILRDGSLTEAERKKRLAETMADAVFRKPKAHCFEDERQITEQHAMSQIGG